MEEAGRRPRADRPRVVDVAIVGGGISGLAAALELADAPRPLRFVVLEASHRPGGQIETETLHECLLEAGPDTLLAAKPHGVKLCERLGLGGELQPFAAPRVPLEILHRGRLTPLPEGFALMTPTRWAPVLRSPLFSISGIARMLAERFVPPRGGDGEDESLTSFVTRRFGRELHERIVEPIVAGLLIADADRLSVRAALPRFLEMERAHGSVSRAVARQAAPLGQGAYLRGGMRRLVDALVERLGADRVETQAHVDSVSRSASGGVRLRLQDGRELLANTVILACPAHAAARLVASLAPGLGRELERLRYAPCVTVNLIYPTAALDRVPRSAGFFVPRAERSTLLACSFVTTKFDGRAPPDRVVLRAFLGGAARPPEVIQGDDAELVERAHAALAPAVGIRAAPSASRVHRYPNAMPQFDVGHLDWVARTRAAAATVEGLCLAGGSLGMVGIPDCIASGVDAAQRALAVASRGPGAVERAAVGE